MAALQSIADSSNAALCGAVPPLVLAGHCCQSRQRDNQAVHFSIVDAQSPSAGSLPACCTCRQAGGQRHEPSSRLQAGGASACMPFCVTRPVTGRAMQQLPGRQHSAIAARLGRLLAELHGMPLPAASGKELCPGSAGCDQLQQGLAGLRISGGGQSAAACQPVFGALVRASAADQTAAVHHATQASALDDKLGMQSAFWQAEGALHIQKHHARLIPGNSQAPQQHPRQITISLSSHSRAALEPSMSQPVPRTAVGQQLCHPLYQPFVDFLRHRRRQAPAELTADRSLPRWMLAQLADYLPVDPAVLLQHVPLGATQGRCMSALQPPCWLHGDLTTANILCHEDGNELQACLIDFADAGHGDPLWDLIVLFVRGFRYASRPQPCLCRVTTQYNPPGTWSMLPMHKDSATRLSTCSLLLCTLVYKLQPALLTADRRTLCIRRQSLSCRCKEPPLQALMQAYMATSSKLASRSPPAPWGPSKNSVSMRYAAMCYMLLHEQDLMPLVFKAHPDLWELASLAELECTVWGALSKLEGTIVGAN